MRIFKNIIIPFFIIHYCILAQPTKGSFVFGGNLGFHIESRDTMNMGTKFDGSSSIIEIDIGPRFGYYFSDHSLIGISIGYSWSKYENMHDANSENSTSQKYSLKYIDPYLRFSYYFSEYWGVFTDLSIYYYWGTAEYSLYHGNSTIAYETYNSDITRYSLWISPGFAFNLSNRVSIEATISILSASKTSSELTSPQVNYPPRIEDGNFFFSLNLSTFRLGVNIIL
jgi:hypothetical protein